MEDLGRWTGKAVEHCGWGLASLPVSSSVSTAFSLIWFDFHSPISVFSRAEVFILTEASVFFIAHILNIPSENTSLKPRPHRVPGLPFYLLPYVYGPFELIFT